MDCPCCASPLPLTGRSIPYQGYQMFSQGTDFAFEKILFCASCGAGIAFPIVSDQEIEQYYAKGNYWGKYKTDIFKPALYPGLYSQALSRWQWIKETIGFKESQELSVLDIGAGHGFIGLAVFEDKSVRLKKYCAVEKDGYFLNSLSKTAVCRNMHGVCDLQQDLSAVKGSFDVIIISHVLEHLYHPGNFLLQAINQLAPGGHVFIEVPYQDYNFKKNIFPHVLFYERSALEQLLSGAGLLLKQASIVGRSQEQLAAIEQRPYYYLNMLNQLVYHLRRCLPLVILVSFYNYYFRANQTNPRGGWLRIMGVQKGKQ